MNEPEAPIQPPRSLVVDDDDRNRRLLDALLVPEGYAVIEASCGETALDLVARGAADLVLLDVMMPGLDGIEVCRRIRQMPASRVLPVIFVTALGDRDARVRGKLAGGDEFLSKPIDEVELLVRVRNLLEIKAYHDLRDRQRELLEAELERRTALWLHAERLATLGTLASAVGHELNNVNAVFLSYLKFVRDRAAQGLPPETKDLETIGHMTDHLRMHARNLLSLGRPGPDTVTSVDVGKLTDSVVAMLQMVGRLKHAHVRVHRDDEPATVHANRSRLEQVLINVLGNADDAVAEISSRERAIDVFVRKSGNPGDERVVVSVRDNGCGIPADQQARVFEPYFTTKPPGRGTGLGLVVVRQIVESLEGSIRLESRVDEETIVTLDFPAER